MAVFRYWVFLLAIAGVAEADSWQKARAVPSDSERSEPGEMLIVPEDARDMRLAAAHLAYTTWSEQLFGALTSPGQTADWREFLGMDVGLGLAYKQMAEGAYNDQRYAEAAELFSIARDFLPDDLELLRSLGFALKSSGRYEESLEVLEIAQQPPAVRNP